jgi:hypothetical protein
MSRSNAALEWLLHAYKDYCKGDLLIPFEIIEHAAQMEKDQIKAAYNKGYQDGEIDSLDAKDGDVQSFNDAENYYTETYVR